MRKRFWRLPLRPATRGRQTRSQQSEREREFLRHWIALAGPRLTPQYVFHPTRKWKFDWAHPESRVAIEVHGGVWIGGRHVRGLGFAGDRLKVNAALRLNWKVFELTTADLTDDRIYAEIMDEIARREVEGVPDRTGLIPLGDVYADRRKSRGHRRGTAKWSASVVVVQTIFDLISDDVNDPRIHREILDEIRRRLREGIPTDRDGLEPFAEVYPDRKRRDGQAHLL